MKSTIRKTLSVFIIALMTFSMFGTTLAATPMVSKSQADMLKVKETDKIMFSAEIITDGQTLLQRAKNNVMDVDFAPRIAVQGAEKAQIIGYTNQKVMERVTEDGITITSIAATVVYAGSGSFFSPGNASGLLYYSITGVYNMYTSSSWSGIKYMLVSASASYTSNNSGGETGIINWELAVAVPTGGYSLSNGAYNANAHSYNNTAYKSGYNPYPGDTLSMSTSNMQSWISGYGNYCYSTIRTSLLIETIRGNRYSLYFDL